MGISRSTYYVEPAASDDTALVETIATICDELEHYGWRRVRTALRQRGMVVNHKKIRRLMREHDLQPRLRRKRVTTTDSTPDEPIFPNRVPEFTVDGPDRLWSQKSPMCGSSPASSMWPSSSTRGHGASSAIRSADPSTRG